MIDNLHFKTFVNRRNNVHLNNVTHATEMALICSQYITSSDIIMSYTASQKKQDAVLLPVTLLNAHRVSKYYLRN